MSTEVALEEGYFNAGLGERFKIRKDSLRSLVLSNVDLLNDNAFNRLIEDEEFDFQRRSELAEVEAFVYQVIPSRVVTLSKAIRMSKGLIPVNEEELILSLENEIIKTLIYNPLQESFLYWVCLTIGNVRGERFEEVKNRATSELVGRTHFHKIDNVDNLTLEERTAVFEEIVEDFFNEEYVSFSPFETIYASLALALLNYERGNLVDFKYHIMKANQLNKDYFVFYLLVKLLNDQMVLHDDTTPLV